MIQKTKANFFSFDLRFFWMLRFKVFKFFLNILVINFEDNVSYIFSTEHKKKGITLCYKSNTLIFKVCSMNSKKCNSVR